MRCSAASLVDAFRIDSFSHSALENSVLIRPGAMQFTRIPSVPHVFAQTWVSMIMAALEIE